MKILRERRKNRRRCSYLDDIVERVQWARNNLQNLTQLIVIIKNILEFFGCVELFVKFGSLRHFFTWQSSFHSDKFPWTKEWPRVKVHSSANKFRLLCLKTEDTSSWQRDKLSSWCESQFFLCFKTQTYMVTLTFLTFGIGKFWNFSQKIDDSLETIAQFWNLDWNRHE